MLSTTISAISIITKEQLAKATALHTKYMLGAGVLLVFLVIIGTAINTVAPFSGWNAFIAMLLGLLAIFLITKPTALAIIFLATSIGGLPNLEIGKIFREGLDGLPDFRSKDVFVAGTGGIEKWLAISGYVILSMMLFHLVMEFVPFHGNIMLVFTVLAILEGLAIREYLYYEESSSKHYKKWTLYLLLMALLISIIRVASLSISGEDIKQTFTAIRIEASSLTAGTEEAKETAFSDGPSRCPVIFTTDFEPSKGKLTLPMLNPGSYVVETSGERIQDFLDSSGNITTSKRIIRADGTMQPDGVVWLGSQDLKKRGLPIPYRNLFPDKPYGALVLHINKKPVFAGTKYAINTEEVTEVIADVNNFQHPNNYWGEGSLQITIKQCS